MTTLEFMKKELLRLRRNHYNAVLRDAPAKNISDLQTKITHYEIVCELLKGVYGE